MSLLVLSASVAFSPTQANCLSLGEINSSQLVTTYDNDRCGLSTIQEERGEGVANLGYSHHITTYDDDRCGLSSIH